MDPILLIKIMELLKVLAAAFSTTTVNKQIWGKVPVLQKKLYLSEKKFSQKKKKIQKMTG